MIIGSGSPDRADDPVFRYPTSALDHSPLISSVAPTRGAMFGHLAYGASMPRHSRSSSADRSLLLEGCLGLDLPHVEGSVRRCHAHEEQLTVPHGEDATGPHPGEEGLDHDVVEGVQTLWQDGHDPDMDVLDHCASEFVGIRRLGPVVGTLTGWLGDRTPVTVKDSPFRCSRRRRPASRVAA